MLYRSVFVNHDLSIQSMIRLDDAENILIGRLDTLWKYRDMLLGRLTGIDKKGVQIHVRPQLLNANADQYLPYLQFGAQLTLWQSYPPVEFRKLNNLTIVNLNPASSALQEGFLVIRTPSASRLLAGWQDANKKIVGVLVTNPEVVEKVADHLDRIVIQSEAR